MKLQSKVWGKNEVMHRAITLADMLDKLGKIPS